MLPDVVLNGPPMAGAADTDLGTFARIFEAQRPGALRLAYAMTGAATIAEDAVAEAFARTYSRWVKGGVRDPDSYVRRAVVNEVRDIWRRRATRHAHAARQPRGIVSTAFGDDRIADADILQRALATLPPRQRAVVVLRVVEDLSEAETANALGCSAGTVKSYLSRGLERLRAALAETEGHGHG